MPRKPLKSLTPAELEQLRNTTLQTLAEMVPEGTPAVVTTEVLSKIVGVRAATIRSGVYRLGHWCGLRPLKLGRDNRWKIRG